MPGTIGIPTGEFTRFAQFGQSLAALHYPPQTYCVWTTGGNIARNFNRIVAQMRDEWVWFIGDDHAFHPDILTRLLEHQVDVVVPLCAQRTPPYSYGVYDWPDEQGVAPLIPLDHRTGLVPVAVCGSAGMLVRRYVFDKLDQPYFRLGTMVADAEGEDIDFCKRVHDAGFHIYVDTDTALGHSTVVTAWPQRTENGTYGTKLDLGNERHFIFRVGE